jgi:uridylate kinase
MFEPIRQYINQLFDAILEDMALNDKISLEEFQLKLQGIETARLNAMAMIDMLDPLSNNLL